MGNLRERIGLVGVTGQTGDLPSGEVDTRTLAFRLTNRPGHRCRRGCTRSSQDSRAGIAPVGYRRATLGFPTACIQDAHRHTGAMIMRTGYALCLLLGCAALACSGSKSDETKGDGSTRSDSSVAAEAGPSGPDTNRPDGQGLDGAVSDGPAQDAPVPVADGQAPIVDALDATGDRAASESGAPALDTALTSDGRDAGGNVLPDTRPANDTVLWSTDTLQADTLDGPMATDGGTENTDGSAESPDAAMDGPGQCGRIMCDCTYNGKQLWGKVQYVDSFPDFKVKVSYFPDLNVQETLFPTGCGQWQVVTAFPDFKVQKVDYFEDFDIAYSSFPGIP
jgi:hypothetical protein